MAVEQDSHWIVGQRGEVVGLLVIAGLVACIELQPAWVRASGIVRKHGLEAFGGGSRPV